VSLAPVHPAARMATNAKEKENETDYRNASLFALITIISTQAFGQCTTNRHFPNYMASVDGYAPADYDGDGLADWSIKDFSGAWTIDYRQTDSLAMTLLFSDTVARLTCRFPLITMETD